MTMMEMVPSTRRRVRSNSDARINRRIDNQIERNLLYFSAHRAEIAGRLAELDQEWDIERMIQANAVTLALLGTLSAARGARGSLLLPLLVTGFLLQYAVQGWCPPVPILRRLGFRTADEINRERYALKALRGDFEKVPEMKSPAGSADAAIRAVDA
jgi:hypothetical protein